MQLEYKILWIDNDLQSYVDNDDVKSIEDFLSEHGFKPVIEKVFDATELEKSILKYDYDLIISDYNLDNTTGDVIIEDIRNKKRLDTEILFYTAQSSYKDNPEVIKRLAFIERLTFQIGRENLLDKIEKVIQLTLKKLLDINATRGIITAVTSDLDVEIANVYKLIIEFLSEDNLKQKIEKIFKTDYKEIKRNHLKNCKSQRDCHLSNYSLYFSQSDSFRKYDILKELLKLKSIEGFDLSLFKTYKDDVIGIRNKFAHAKAEERDGKIVLIGQYDADDFEFDSDKCIEIRKKLIQHKTNIEHLKRFLEQNGSQCTAPQQ